MYSKHAQASATSSVTSLKAGRTIGQVSDPTFIRPGCRKLPGQLVRRQGLDRTFPQVTGQTAPGWPSLQRLLTHQARHPLSAAPIPPSQHIRPHPPDTVALTTLSKTTTNPAYQHLIIPGPLTRWSHQPTVKTTRRDIEHLAHPPQRPYPSMRRYKRIPQRDALAK